MNEFELIRIASRIFSTDRQDVIVGPGEDDCAVVEINGKNIVLTADVLHEKTDFPEGIKAEEIGHLSLAVNLSDLAAMGAKPLYFIHTVTLSRKWINEFEDMMKGMKKLAERYGVAVVGGDIDFGDELSIAGFAVGVADRFVTQSGAKPGEFVCLTGPLGKAQLSLEQLFSGMSREKIAYPESLFTPEPRVREGMEVAKHAGAMTDISDSLAISLHLIAEKSRVGIEIRSDLLPLDHLTPYVGEEKALELFLYSGGDYELVYTSNECTHGFVIGRVVEEKGVRIDGEEIEFRGYMHKPD
ncbi:thiamine-phosphate kinase [Archaeoglobus veneficus]|uniref:Thiamine-monophosphate kinase n=1 Tax=Archaeoglobus veneficus (strain DSM 11195 / SNP6) TaxID=693661 RepID=F2KQS4_ARCVS|nr:thiamine-phosphate kinase [Archaeoglobus veneficus]AEA46636.1 thiamine-monophosphate kinase [Archaeoglobus veneficus SNP6]